MIILKDFVQVLNEEKIGATVLSVLESKLEDLRSYGLEERIISGLTESIACKEIVSNKKCEQFAFQLKPGQCRTFYDGTIGDEPEPLDFKATFGLTTDNLSAQGAILYVLTGNLIFREENKRLSDRYLSRFAVACTKALSNKIDKDFGYLILNKKMDNLIMRLYVRLKK